MKLLKRELTIPVLVGNVKIGSQNKIVIQSMTNTKTHDIDKTLKQINDLVNEGCELVRVAVFDINDANALNEIVKKSPCPIIADIHFNPEFAIMAIKAGVSKIRLNPGNIDDHNIIKNICQLANEHSVVIRIGVNSGSLPKKIEKKYGHSAKAMVAAAKEYVKLFESFNFFNIVISLKCSDPLMTIDSYLMAAKVFNYPMHIGVTEAGSLKNGSIKSSAGLAPIIYHGVGDTIRVSITGDPVQEINVCKKILSSFHLYENNVDIISCPTCGRLNFNLEDTTNEIEEYVKKYEFPLKISILGCIVNGIGEAKNADIGIAGSNKTGILFENGRIIKTLKQELLVHELKKLIDKKYQEWVKKNK
ncbi:MAG: flavodoxin-dependent (E)-4-hydroxy-3-methylbut-2-enyl-diphosphate synthase [Mycoplasmoidaceae bacterium]